MINNIHFKKGDILIDFGKAYIVSEIKNQKNFEGITEPFIIYKPWLDDWPDRSLVCSIPMSSLSSSNMRRPLKKVEINNLLNLTNDKVEFSKFHDDVKFDEILQSNDLVKIIKLLIRLWVPVKDQTNKTSKTRRRTCSDAIEILSLEIGIVYNIPREKAEQLLLSKLE
jgi:RNA polymerase-interacting CarD/CdnL/TRCF family regulator